MTDNDFLIDPNVNASADANRVSIPPTRAESVRFALTDSPRGETDESMAVKADYLGSVYFDLLQKAQRGIDPNQDDAASRAEAVYFSEAMTGQKDVYGKLWQKGGFKTGREYLDKMHDFFLHGGERNLTPELKEFRAMSYEEQVAKAMSDRSTLDALSHAIGSGFSHGVDWLHRADTEKLAAEKDLQEDIYRREVRDRYAAKLMADNAWRELSAVLPTLSEDGQACAKALMASGDNRLPETMYAKFYGLSDEEKRLVCRARTCLSPRVEGGFWNAIGDMGVGAANVASSVAAAPYRFGNALFDAGLFFNGLKIGDYEVDSDIFDVNEIARRRQYLWQATGRFSAGGDAVSFHLPQMQFEQICEDHGFVAEAAIGAVSTLPYMAAAAVPGIGVMTVAMEAVNEMNDHVALNGGDITDPDYLLSSAIFGGLYAYTERLQVEGLLGGVSDLKVREAMLKGFFSGIRDGAPVRNLAIGTLSESVQEGLQNGIKSANEALALDGDATAAFAEGFTQDFVNSLGTMFVVEAGGLVSGHWKRSGFNNPFTAAGRLEGRESRSADLESVYEADMSKARLVDYAKDMDQIGASFAARENQRLLAIWKEGGKDALVRAGIDPVRAEEWDYYYASLREDVQRDAVPDDERADKAAKDVAAYIEGRVAEELQQSPEEAQRALAESFSNLDRVRSVWAQGAGVAYRTEDGKTVDAGAKALEGMGFTPEHAARISRLFHYERAAAYSPAALEGIREMYAERFGSRVGAVAAMARQFGGRVVNADGNTYIRFDRADGTQLVQIVESSDAVDFGSYDEGIAVDVEKATNGEVTKDDWRNMTPDERRQLWNDRKLFAEGYFQRKTAPVEIVLPADPSARVTSGQAATVVGTIHVTDTSANARVALDSSAAFHETYHAFSYFAQASGLWTKEDVEYLKGRFGAAKAKGETHDEENAADGFRAFLARRAAGALTAEDEKSPFAKIYAAAAGLDDRSRERAAEEANATRQETAFFQQLLADQAKTSPAPTVAPAPPAPTATPAPSAPTSAPAAPAPNPQPAATNPQPASSGPKIWQANVPNTGIIVSGEYRIVRLSELVHSGNPAYAAQAELQKRFRTDNKVSEEKLEEIKNRFFAKYYLQDAASTADGAPIVALLPDADGVNRLFVISGNGRVMVLNALKDAHFFDRYRNALKELAAKEGYELADVGENDENVLVRVITDLGGSTLEEIATYSNTENTTARTEIEQARVDADAIRNLHLADLYVADADGMPNMQKGVNDDFFRIFSQNAPDGARIYDAKRNITEDGQNRVLRALLYLSCGMGERGPAVVEKMIGETSKLGIRRQRTAMECCAAPIVALETKSAYAIGADVSRAMADYIDFIEKKAAGRVGTLSDYLAEDDMFDPRSAIASRVLDLLASDRSAPAIAAYVKAYCDSAAKSDADGSLMGSAASRTREEIWRDAAKLVDEKAAEKRYAVAKVSSPQFKRWFGESKVVDENGNPLVVYRGAPFNPTKQTKGKGVIRPESYFTADPEYANRYGETEAYYLRIERPFDIRNPEDAQRLAEFYPNGYKIATGHNGALDWAEMSNFDLDELREKYPEYDGIILDEGGDPLPDGSVKYRGVSYVPFDGGAQVKSATANSGDFSENPDVRFSVVKTDTPQFKRWFGDSKMVDENGKPRVFYHGTSQWVPEKMPRGKAVFSDDYTGTGSGDVGFFGRGFYFAFTEGEARSYGGHVSPVYLKIENPFNYQKELCEWHGEGDASGYADHLPVCINIAKKFPTIAKEYKAKWYEDFDENGNGGEIKEVSLDDIAKEAERIFKQVEFKIVKVYDGLIGRDGGYRTFVKAEPYYETFNGHKYKNYKISYECSDEVSAKEKITQVYKYLTKISFPNLTLPSGRDMIMGSDFSGELRKRGYDGIIQSEEGDEAVVFSSNQIKSATANNGDFSDDADIRYAVKKVENGNSIGFSADMSKMENAKSFREFIRKLPPAETPNRLPSGNPKDVFAWFVENMVGKTFSFDIPGYGHREFKVTPGHIGKLVCSGKSKGIIKKEYDGNWEDAVLRGEIKAEDVTGWDMDRAMTLPRIPQLLTKFDAALHEVDRGTDVFIFLKKFETKNGRPNTIVMKLVDDGKSIGPISTHIKDFTLTWLRNKDLVLTDENEIYSRSADSSASGKPPEGDNAESNSPTDAHSIPNSPAETQARRAVKSYAAESMQAAEDALENYVAYFKLSHGSVPRPQTLARLGLSLGMNVVDPKRILRNADRLADRAKGSLVEKAAKNGDIGTAMSLLKREKDIDKAVDDLIAGGVALGGQLTHKGVGQVNSLIQRALDRKMASMNAATLADMEGDTGLDIASEILANNPDAFDTEYRKAKKDAESGETDDDQANDSAPDEPSSGNPAQLSDSERYKRAQLLKEANEKVVKFIEEAKRRAADNKAKAEERHKRVAEIQANGGEAGEGGAADVPSDEHGPYNPTPTVGKADFKTPGEFAAFLRIWAQHRFAKEHGISTFGKSEQDRLFAEFYRLCVKQELQDLADKLLAPTDETGQPIARLAKLGAGARVWVNRRLAEMEKGLKPDRIERMSADIFAFINKAAVRVSRVDLITSLKDEIKTRFVKDPHFDEFKQDTDRKVTGWVEEAARYICRVCDLSRISVNGDSSQLEKEYQRLHDIIDRRAQVYDESGKEVGAAAQEDAETLKAQWMLSLLDKFGAMRSLMPGEILDLQNAAFKYLEEEAAKLEAVWRETRVRQEQVRGALSGAIVGPNGQRYDAKGTFAFFERLFDGLNGLIRLRLRHLTRFASDAARKAADDAINTILVMLGDGETAFARALQDDRDNLFRGLAAIFRKPDGSADNAAIKRYLERMDEKIPPELARQISNQGYAESMTYGQMLQLLVSLEQRSFKDTVEANGRQGQAEMIRSFTFADENGNRVRAFTREDDAFVDFLRAFYAAKRDVLSEVTLRMVGHKVDSPDPLYCPIRRLVDDKARSLHADPTTRWDPISKIFSRRVESVRDFDEGRTILGLFFENSRESAKLTAWAERGSFIRNVVTSVSFQTAVKRAFGAGELGKILKQLEATFNGGDTAKMPDELAFVDKALNFTTYAYLGFNPLSAAKQTTSFTVWANALPGGFVDLWRHMTHFDKDVVRHLKESDEYKVRYGNDVGSGQDLATKGLHANPSQNPFMRTISGAGMWLLKKGDFAPGIWIAQGVYKDILNRHLQEGMSHEEADRLAITETFNMLEETQQSGRAYNTNMLTIEHGRIGRMLTQFATSPLQQLQYETQALREWRDMVKYNQGEKKIADARHRFFRAAIINHVLLPAALNLVISIYKAAMGEEPPWEKDGYHWTLLTEILMGQFSRVFFLGAFAQTTFDAIFKRERPRASQLLPVEGALGMISSVGITIHDLVAMNVDNLQRDLERLLKGAAPTRVPYNLVRRLTGDADVDRKAKEESKRK